MAQELARRVAERASNTGSGAEVAEQPKKRTVYELINAQKAEIARALPRHMNPDRLARIAITTLRQTPRLLECTPESLLAALMLSAQLGLEPGPLGHCYFVPFWNKHVEWIDDGGRKRKGAFEVTWIIGYKGVIDLARRSGQLESIEARVVYDKDDFEFEYGLEDKLTHRPFMGGGDPGEIRAFYGIARFKDGGRYFVVLPKHVVDAHKARSKSGAKDDGPWATDYVAMGCKTVIRVMAPFLPLSAELAGALEHDDAVHRDVAENMVELPAPPRVIEGERVAEIVDDEPDATEARAIIDEEPSGDQPSTSPQDAEPAADGDAANPAETAEDYCPACGATPSHPPADCPMAAELDESTDAE